MDSAYLLAPQAFDSFAATYDVDFTSSAPGQWLRGAVLLRLAPFLRPGLRVLDLGCGTGEDAIWLARSGCDVTAVDSSPAMLDRVRQKALANNVADKIISHQLDLNAPAGLPGSYDLVLSNFGALNCAIDLAPIGALVRSVLAPGGTVAFNVMGRFCAWESLWYGLRGRRAAIRRWRGMSTAAIGRSRIPVRYWSAGEIRSALGREFHLQSVHGIGIALPPSDLFPIFHNRPWLFRRLVRWEARLSRSPILARLADHQLSIFRRTNA